MSQFKLEFISETFQYEERGFFGKITIENFFEDFFESFFSPTVFWSKEDYYRSWLNELENLSLNKKAFLATSMYEPLGVNYIFGWSIYLVNDIVYCQNNIIFLDEFNGLLDLSKLSYYVSDRITISEEGQEISEWQSTPEDVKTFVGELRNTLMCTGNDLT